MQPPDSTISAHAPRRRFGWLGDPVLSLLILLTVLTGFELALRTDAVFGRLPMPRPYYSYDVTRRLSHLHRLQRELGQVDVVFVGSSIVRAGIHPKVFDNKLKELGQDEIVSFNGGLSHMYPVALRYYVEHLWLKLARPRYVLHGVRPAEVIVSERLFKGFQKGRVESKWLEGTPLAMLQADLIQHSRLVQYRGVLRTLIERTRDGKPWHADTERGEILTNERGFRGERVGLAQKKKRGQNKRLWRYRSEPRDEQYRNSEEALDQMNAACKAAGAQYVLVNMPEHPERFDAENGPAVFSDYHRHMRAWAKKHGVPFIDITDGELQGFADDRDYSDYHHLTRRGAERFTAALAERFAPLRARSPRGR